MLKVLLKAINAHERSASRELFLFIKAPIRFMSSKSSTKEEVCDFVSFLVRYQAILSLVEVALTQDDILSNWGACYAIFWLGIGILFPHAMAQFALWIGSKLVTFMVYVVNASTKPMAAYRVTAFSIIPNFLPDISRIGGFKLLVTLGVLVIAVRYQYGFPWIRSFATSMWPFLALSAISAAAILWKVF